MCMIAPIVSKTALSEQKQDSLNTSVSVVAPEMQQLHSLPFSNTFFTLLPTKGGVAGDVASATRAQVLLLEPCIAAIVVGIILTVVVVLVRAITSTQEDTNAG